MADWIRQFHSHSRHENSAATYWICRCKRTNVKCMNKQNKSASNLCAFIADDVPDVIDDIYIVCGVIDKAACHRRQAEQFFRLDAALSKTNANCRKNFLCSHFNETIHTLFSTFCSIVPWSGCATDRNVHHFCQWKPNINVKLHNINCEPSIVACLCYAIRSFVHTVLQHTHSLENTETTNEPIVLSEYQMQTWQQWKW